MSKKCVKKDHSEFQKTAAIFLSAAAVFIAAALKMIYERDRMLDVERFRSKKFFSMFRIMDRWLEAKQNGKSMARGLLKCGYSTAAIYGMHYIGERLAEELKDSQVKVLYAIDENICGSNQEIRIYRPDEKFPQADVIIIASTVYFYEMKNRIAGKIDCPVISIEEAVESMC